MIHITCQCGKNYEVPEQYAGKKVRCKKCNSKMQIPSVENEDSAVIMAEIVETSDIESSSPKKQSIVTKMSENTGLPEPLIYLFVSLGIIIVVSLLYIFVFRDTWETANYSKLSQLIREAEQHYNHEEYEEGLKKFDELWRFTHYEGRRALYELKNEELRKKACDIQGKYLRYEEKIEAEEEKQAELARQEEARRQAEEKAKADAAEKERKLHEFKSRLMSLIKVGEEYAAEGDVANAVKAYEEALELTHQNDYLSPDLKNISQTLEEGINKFNNLLVKTEEFTNNPAASYERFCSNFMSNISKYKLNDGRIHNEYEQGLRETGNMLQPLIGTLNFYSVSISPVDGREYINWKYLITIAPENNKWTIVEAKNIVYSINDYERFNIDPEDMDIILKAYYETPNP